MKREQLLYDLFSPLSLIPILNSLYPKEKLFFLESGIQNREGNYSFIFVGEREGVKFQKGETFYFDGQKWSPIRENPFQFLKRRFKEERERENSNNREFSLLNENKTKNRKRERGSNIALESGNSQPNLPSASYYPASHRPTFTASIDSQHSTTLTDNSISPNSSLTLSSQEDKLPIVDGFIGYIGFEMVQFFEPILIPHFANLKRELEIPELYLIRPKLTLVYSHRDFTLHLIPHTSDFEVSLPQLKRELDNSGGNNSFPPLKPAKLEGEPQFSFNRERFYWMVEQGKKHIEKGDIFQIVLSNRLKVVGEVDKFSFYRLLRATNPSPYLFYLDYGDFALIGSSPEIMVKKDGDRALVRPIAGTRRRGRTLEEDLIMEQELRSDKKEQAEHIMLVDLGRNDIGRVSKGGSVEVVELMRVERYSHVMHLVSDVIGKLPENVDQFDLFQATFPAGTVSGAPKIKAMELIARYEGIARNFYSGAVGYFGIDGNMDTAIAIRTALWTPTSLYFQAGAGIVADSQPRLEYKEINNKLGALLATLRKLTIR